MAEHNKAGKTGEDVAFKYLRREGHKLLKKNYTRKWGEIDIVTYNKKTKTIHFVEVKSVSCENLDKASVDTEILGPEERIDDKKLKRISRAIQTYITENRLSRLGWQFDVLVVFLDTDRKEAKIKELKNVIIGA